MSVFLSPVGGAGAQFFDNNGNPLTGGKLYTYAAGTTTPQATYTTSAGNIAHTNPVVLDAAGRVADSGEIWLTAGSSYKFVLKTSTDVTISTWDNITGNGDPNFNYYTPAATSLLAPGPLTVKSALDQITNEDNGSSLIGYLAPFAGASPTTAQLKLDTFVNATDFGAMCDWNGSSGTDDTVALQSAINYCVANQKDLLIPGLSLISASLNIDRLVDSAAADNYFTIASVSGGGVVVNTAIAMFSTTLVNSSDPNLPVSQMIRFSGLKFESTNSALAAYVLDQNKLFRLLIESCNFRKIKCLNAPAGKLTQTITFQNCQARRWSGTFFKSDEATFDLKVLGGLWEAGGDAFDIDFPVGTAFIGANIEGMATFAIKYTGGYALTVQGCYFEENGNNDANGCSIDGSAGTGGAGSEAVSIIGNYFSGDTDTPSKPQIKWGDDVTAVSTGNLCSTTLHQFGANSRVNIVADYARTAISTNDATIYNGIRNDLHVGAVFRADGQYKYGGIVRSEFIGGSGAFLKLRSLQNGVESSKGLDIDDNGDVKVTGNAGVIGYTDITEISSFPTPPANTARLFAKDNGSGKTQLAVLFSTGAVQVIATEP
jgi:hypothetical protein